MQPVASTGVDENEQEYRAIEAALLQTARGRWFLAEMGRRSRRVDSQTLEDALGRLQASISQPPAVLGQLKTELEVVMRLLSETQAQTRAKPAPATGDGSAPPVEHTMLRTAEDIHELTWSLQSATPDPERAEQIARHASILYAMSLQQAAESKRLLALGKSLDEASSKLAAVLETIMHESSNIAAAVPPAEGR